MVKNCGKFLAVELSRRFQIKGQDHEEELSADELPFSKDESDYLFVKASGHDLYDADALSAYLLEKFWTSPSSRE